ncbi:ABC transporter ATP-binding protein [Thermodesulfovibrio sp.]|uniref:ABC transporter ATP-binding protein n=1 Tax=Thermodesulfovibrio sp. TaxID=2067987 RepID=UPI003C7D58EB
MSSIIQLKNVNKKIKDETILKDINLSVNKGEFISIVGPSGSGKSSLLYIIGLLDTPSEGEVFVEKQKIDFEEKNKIAHLRNMKFGFIFQFHYLVGEFTLLENVMVPMLKAGKTKKEATEKAYSLLKKLGLNGKEKRKPFQISGGEQQRVAIARALANDPIVIIADEPTGNLDSKNTAIVMDIFCKLHLEGRTVIMVTHEIELTEKAERIIKMLDGKIVEDIELNKKNVKLKHDYKNVGE